MPYAMFDDNFAEHPKVDSLSDAAFRLHVAGIIYCAKHLTDGHMTADRPSRLVPRFRPAALEELLRTGIWHENGSGYQIHDYLQWNKSRDWWEAKREKDAKRMAKWREEQEAKQRESQRESQG